MDTDGVSEHGDDKFEFTDIIINKVEEKHISLKSIEDFLQHGIYPNTVTNKGQKSNFRRACKKFKIVNGLFMRDDRIVITDKNRQMDIIRSVHNGLGENVKAKAMSSHPGRTSTHEKIKARFYWYTMYDDVANYVKRCDRCQKQRSIPKDTQQQITQHTRPKRSYGTDRR